MTEISLDYKATQKLPKLVSVKAVCEILEVSRTVVMRLVYTGALSAALVGSYWVIGAKSLDDYLSQLETGSEALPEK